MIGDKDIFYILPLGVYVSKFGVPGINNLLDVFGRCV